MSYRTSRRQWIVRAAHPLLIWKGIAGAQRLPNSQHLVADPGKRAEYLKRMLRILCTEIGPRFACTEACERGAEVVRKEMQLAVPEVRLDTFTITGWELEGKPTLRIGDREVETYVSQYGPGTPANGLRGSVRKNGKQYLIADGSGKAMANIDLGPFGPAVVSSYHAADKLPRFSVGRQDIAALDSAAEKKTPVVAKAIVRPVPNCKTSNVVGTLPGQSADEILYVAHLDTVHGSPGASDNTASMIAMIMLAHGFSGTRPKHTYRWVATAAEEGGSKGARHYAEVRKAEGTLGRVKMCINLDSLTYGPNLQITTTDKGFQTLLVDLHKELKINATPKIIERDDTMDSGPFKEAGARTVHLNSRGYDAKMLPLNHRPDDKAETIDPALIENCYRILMEFTRRLDASA
ncbi:MAG: M20/M25/M40 family metallo-hydrolase [Bryobacterales bacterium]|nr:M20/M25/M40 family metallo-hydrolase [Bryobacterales bacterium]